LHQIFSLCGCLKSTISACGNSSTCDAYLHAIVSCVFAEMQRTRQRIVSGCSP
jgi:hypothetical protein